MQSFEVDLFFKHQTRLFYKLVKGMNPLQLSVGVLPADTPARGFKVSDSRLSCSPFAFVFPLPLHHHHYPSHQLASNEAPPPLSVTGQPLDGAPAVVHLLHFRFYSSSPGCLRSTTLPLSLWSPVDCKFGDGVDIIAQRVPNPAPSLSGDDGLRILLLAPC